MIALARREHTRLRSRFVTQAEQQRCSKLLSDAQSEIKARKTRLSLPEARKEADTLKAELERCDSFCDRQFMINHRSGYSIHREQQALAILQQAAGGKTLTPAQADSVKLNYKRLLKTYKSRFSFFDVNLIIKRSQFIVVFLIRIPAYWF